MGNTYYTMFSIYDKCCNKFTNIVNVKNKNKVIKYLSSLIIDEYNYLDPKIPITSILSDYGYIIITHQKKVLGNNIISLNDLEKYTNFKYEILVN